MITPKGIRKVKEAVREIIPVHRQVKGRPREYRDGFFCGKKGHLIVTEEGIPVMFKLSQAMKTMLELEREC